MTPEPCRGTKRLHLRAALAMPYILCIISAKHHVRYIEPPIYNTAQNHRPLTITLLIRSNNSPKPLHRLHNLLAVLLRHPLLHHLRRALNKLLAVHQTQAQHALDLLDDLRLGPGVERFQRQREERLFLGRGRGFFFLGRGRRGGRCGGGETAHWHVGDIQAGLRTQGG